jgi:hypothetical protein
VPKAKKEVRIREPEREKEREREVRPREDMIDIDQLINKSRHKFEEEFFEEDN